jgi:hypothetical protein
MWMGPVSPLAIKLVAFGKGALIQFLEGGPHPSMNKRWGGFDNNCNLVAVPVTEPIQSHRQPFGL